jgi:pyruvate dehydrogenase E2 component (dihydrolipoamide acetyltransferase)
MSQIQPIAVPKWGIEMVEGTVTTWNKEPGDAVAKGDEVFEMESDKIVNSWESPTDGVLRRRLVEEGETLQVGALLGIIAPADTDEAAIDAFIAEFSGASATAEPEAATAEAAPSQAPTPAASSAPVKDANLRTNPVVRRLASELNVDLTNITGTGRNGRITQDDVRAAAAGGSTGSAEESAASSAGVYEVIPFTSTRKTIGRRLSQAKQEIPHYYLTVEWEIDNLTEQRSKLKDAGEKVSLNDLIVHGVARALMKVPEVNITVHEDTVHQYANANIAIAIATDDGLYPVTLRNAETLSPTEISAATAELATRTREGTLTREDLSDASFTVSNLGMFGVEQFTAIINPPMGAILALGAARKKPVVRDGQVMVAETLKATLSCDHRAIDGALGARFLSTIGDELAAI